MRKLLLFKRKPLGEKQHSRLGIGFIGLSLGSVLILALLALLLSFISFEWLRGQLDLVSGDGTADSFTRSIHTTLVWALRILASFGLCLSLTMFVTRLRLAAFVNKIFDQLIYDLYELRSWVAAQSLVSWLELSILIFFATILPLQYFTEPIRYDEAHTFNNYTSTPIYITITKYDAPNNHLLHSIATHISTWIFRDPLFALRLPTLISCIASVLLTYSLSCWFSNRVIGFGTALLLTCLPSFIEAGGNARGHTMGAAFLLMALLCCEVAKYREQPFWLLVLVSFSVAASLYCVPTLVYGVVMLASWTAIDFRKRGWLLVGIFIGGLLAGVAYMPILLTNSIADLRSTLQSQPLSTIGFLHELPNYCVDMWQWCFWSVDWPLQIIVLIGIAASIILAKRSTSITVLACFASLAIILFVQGLLPPVRVFVFLWPLAIFATVLGSYHLFILCCKQWANAATFALTLTVSSLLVYHAIVSGVISDSKRLAPFKPAANVAQFLKQNVKSKQPILVVTPTSAPIIYQFITHGWSLDSFQIPGKGLTDDSVAWIVTSDDFGQTPKDILDQLNLSKLFKAKDAHLVAEVEDAKIWRCE